MKFYIYEKAMFGNDSKLTERDITGNIHDSHNKLIVSATTGEDALNKFYEMAKVCEDDKWLYYASEVEQDDEDTMMLNESGCASWDEYYEDAYPDRPIEL